MIDSVFKLITSIFRSNVVHILQRPYSLQVTVVVFEVHPQEELEHHHAEVRPHCVSKVELVVVNVAGGAEYPQA